MEDLKNKELDLFYEGQDKELFSKITGLSLNTPFRQLLENQLQMVGMVETSSTLSKNAVATLNSIKENIQEQINNIDSNVVLEGATKQSWLVEASMTEGYAEVMRVMGSSGIFSVRQYEYDKSFEPKTKSFDIGYAMIGQHDHPNYEGMCGSAEYTAIVNGYYVRSRHNDYRLRGPNTSPASYLSLKTNPTPLIPQSILDKPTGVSADGTIDKTNDTQAKAMYNIIEDYPEACIWELSYMEVWIEAFTSSLEDPFDSFRHSIDADTIEEALKKAIYLNTSGHKNRLENIPFMPTLIRTVDDNGYPILGTIKYRVISHPVSTFADLPYDMTEAINGTTDLNSFILNKDIKTKKQYNTTWETHIKSRRAKFNMERGVLESLCEKVPGMDGDGSTSVETYSDYGLEDTITDFGTTNIKNASYYNHSYSMMDDDASGRRNAHRGFTDPNLFVAKTTQAKVVGGFTYMIPLEMILRTPLESWNPFNLSNVTYSVLKAEYDVGKGDTIDNPLSGWNENLMNTKIPYQLFGSATAGDSADTGTQNNFILGSDNKAHKVSASGIRTFNPKGQRIRFPVAPNYHEFSKASVDLQVFKEEVKEMLEMLVNGTLTLTDIKNKL